MDTHSRHAPAVPPPGIAIVPMHPDHLDSLADLESLAFSTPWSYDALAEELQNPLAVFLVAEDVDAESAVGYLGMHHILDEGFIANLAVHPAYRRQGCALEALRSWTAAVLEQGIIPLYSTDLHHAASRGLASKGGFVAYAQTLEIWL